MSDPTRAQLADPLWWDEYTAPNDKAWVVNTLTGEEYFTTDLLWDRNVMNITVRPCKIEPEQAPEAEYRESLKAMRERIASEGKERAANKYRTPIGDVYDVLKAFEVTNPALQHLIKKALKVGKRGHKDIETDLQDIIDSAVRAKELEGF